MSTPLVIVRHVIDDDTGPRHVVTIAGVDGPSFVSPALAATYAAQLSAALQPFVAPGQRAMRLRVEPHALDAIQARTASPRSAMMRALRWIIDNVGGEVFDEAQAPEVLEWGDAPTLDRVGEMAVVAGEEGCDE